MESRKRPTLRGEKESEKEETQDIDLKYSCTFKSEGKPRFDKKEDDDLSKKKEGGPKVLESSSKPKENKPE